MGFFIGKALRLNTGTATSGAETSNFVGRCAGASNTTGCHNNFFGLYAGCANTTGFRNIFMGDQAGRENITGRYNNFFGFYAGSCNTYGLNNNFMGRAAGRFNTTGRYNNFFSLFSGLCTTSGRDNNFFGPFAGCANTTGRCNNFIGNNTGRCNTTGCNNNFFGRCTGRLNTSGCENHFFGQFTGRNNTSGCNNLAFGVNSGTTGFTPSGLFNLTTTSNRIVMGNANHTCAQIQIGWTTVSDIRDKCVFGNVKHGKGFLKKLNPIEFAFKDRDFDDITDPLGKTRYGFSAQEVLEAEGDHSVIVSADDPDKLQMTNDYLIPVLVNAIKELTADVEDLQTRLTALETQ